MDINNIKFKPGTEPASFKKDFYSKLKTSQELEKWLDLKQYFTNF